jgi:uncharacterized protein YodC (DUF2158 family)
MKQFMDKKFKTGDIVRLKSGSPEMTVEGYKAFVEGIGRVKCTYFENDVIKRAMFEQDVLELAEKKAR